MRVGGRIPLQEERAGVHGELDAARPVGLRRHDPRASAPSSPISSSAHATDRPSGDQTGCRTSTVTAPGGYARSAGATSVPSAPTVTTLPSSVSTSRRSPATDPGRGGGRGSGRRPFRTVRRSAWRTRDREDGDADQPERATHPHGTKGTARGFARGAVRTAEGSRRPCDTRSRASRAHAAIPPRARRPPARTTERRSPSWRRASATRRDPGPLDGPMPGRVLTTTLGYGLDPIVIGLARLWMPWQGKTFDPEAKEGRNVFTTGFRAVQKVLWPGYDLDWPFGDRSLRHVPLHDVGRARARSLPAAPTSSRSTTSTRRAPG